MSGTNGIGKITRNSLMLMVALSFGALSSAAQTPGKSGPYKGPGRYEIVVAESDKLMALDMQDRRTVCQWSALHGKNQQWDIEEAADGYVYIKSAETGMALDIDGSAKDSATVVVSRPGFRDDGQLWRIEAAPEGRFKISSRLGRALEIPDGAHHNGATLRVASMKPHEMNQRFKLVWISAPAPKSVSTPAVENVASDEKRSYEQGYSLGVEDFRAQLRRTYARHKGKYGREWEEAFIEGYYDGYDNGRGEKTMMRGMESSAYDEGYRRGRQDNQDGRRSNYMRYAERFDSRSEPSFRRGYEDGYYSAR